MINRKHIPKHFYTIVCNDDVDNNLFGGYPVLERTLKSARAERAMLNVDCCDGGHQILKLTTEVVK